MHRSLMQHLGKGRWRYPSLEINSRAAFASIQDALQSDGSIIREVFITCAVFVSLQRC